MDKKLFFPHGITSEEAVALLRKQKHDFLNYLQVILGQLQLRKREKALESTKEAIKKIETAGSVMFLKPSRLALGVILLQERWRAEGVSLEINVGRDLINIDLGTAVDLIGRCLEECLEIVSNLAAEDRRINLEFSGFEDCCQVVFRLPSSIRKFQEVENRIGNSLKKEMGCKGYRFEFLTKSSDCSFLIHIPKAGLGE